VKKIVLAVTGASGSIYARRALHHLEALREHTELEVGVVLSKNARQVWAQEMDEPFRTGFQVYDRMDYTAPFASGSARYTEMLIAPCSMGTMSRSANGFSDDLITRAADVMLKERRQLICLLRDTPLNGIHLENMLRLSRAGALIMPAIPSFYSRPQTFDELADTVIQRALDQMGLPIAAYRWGEGGGE